MNQLNDLNEKLIEQYRVKVMRLLNKIAEHQAEINATEAMIRDLQRGK